MEADMPLTCHSRAKHHLITRFEENGLTGSATFAVLSDFFRSCSHEVSIHILGKTTTRNIVRET